MKRREFLIHGTLVTTGLGLGVSVKAYSQTKNAPKAELYTLFKDPPTACRPFVRWWWNGDKVEKDEILRELQLLKQSGIGGIEINPIRFPLRAKDLGKRSVKWLSPEWVDLLNYTLEQASSLGLICDLIVGSGWPFGAEWLEGNERTQMVSIAVKKFDSAGDYEVSVYELFHEADPGVTSPYSGRTMELVSLWIVPSPLADLARAKDITSSVNNGSVRFRLEDGAHVLYALVSINGFMEVINGAPGADGPVLNHYNADAVRKYLEKMSAAIGPMSGKLRSFFTDSMELEGANWCQDMANEFKRRRGYDLLPYLPFVLFKTGGMGNVFDEHYGVETETDLREKLCCVRYDFEVTKTELLRERFVEPFITWCKSHGVLCRMQAYGRGYHPLDGSFGVDIPECETWIKEGLGVAMGDLDYREGRAYSMINKYVTSAAHLEGKRLISCEELTNTEHVFTETLEILKLASDQSTISGVTHAIFHGFNYSPKDAEFPGWVRYGSFFNERNPWWPYLKLFTDYRSRLAALTQQGTMFADVAILSPIADMWSMYGAQNEPFPTRVHPYYQTCIWEAIHKNGSGCDYLSEKVIQDADTQETQFAYKGRKYKFLLLIEVESLEIATAKKLRDLANAGIRIFCIGKYPSKSPGLRGHQQNDQQVVNLIEGLKKMPNRFILLPKPEKDFVGWFKKIQEDYEIAPYVKIDQPDPFINQVRYTTRAEEILFIINSHIDKEFKVSLTFDNSMVRRKQAWIWDAEIGTREKLPLSNNNLILDLGPASSRILVFDSTRRGRIHAPQNPVPKKPRDVGNWTAEWRHIDGSVRLKSMDVLKDIKEIPDFSGFCGTVIYRADLELRPGEAYSTLSLGKVWGVSELVVNGVLAGIQWWGKRVFDLRKLFQPGKNTIEVRVVTTMGNYLKTLKDNPVAQYWTNEKRKDQPVQSMGLIGPVLIF